MYCPNCGKQSPDEATVCTECGLKFGPVSTEPVYDPAINAYRQPVYIPATIPGKGVSIASLVLGIISVVFFLTAYIAAAIAVVGLVLGIYGKSKSKKLGLPNGSATAGIACSSVCLGIELTILLVAVIAGAFYF